MLVRKAGKHDLVEIHKLLLSIFPNANANLLDNDEFFVAEEKNELAGFAHFNEDEERIILRGFGVLEKSREQGLGNAILDKLIAYAKRRRKSVFLKTKLRNPALRLYCNKGFCFKRIKGETLTMVYRPSN